MRSALSYLFLASSVWVQSFAFAQDQVGEMRIERVNFELNEKVDVPEVIHLLNLQEGDLFSKEKLDQGIARLALTRNFQRVSAEFDTKTKFLSLVLHVHNRLSGVRLNFPLIGENIPDYLVSDVESAVGLKEGDIIGADMIEDIRTRVHGAIERRGFRDFDVVVVVTQTESGADRFLEISIQGGERSFVESFSFAGFEDRESRNLFSELREEDSIVESLTGIGIDGFKKGVLRGPMIFDVEALTRAKERFLKSYRERGFYDIELDIQVQGSVEKRIVHFELSRGYQYDLQIEGMSTFWERELRTKLLERSINLGLPFNILEAELRLQRIYREFGYKDVAIEKRVEISDNVKQITYIVNEGQQFFFKDLVFTGARSSDLKILRESADEWLLPQKSPYHYIYYVPDAIVGRLPAFLQRLRDRGFLDAKILSYRFEKPSDSRFFRLELNVQLGRRYRLRNINVLGNIILTGKELDDLVDIESGEFVNPTKILEIANSFLAEYQKNGFMSADVSLREEDIFAFPREGGVVDVSFSISPGPQVFLGKLIVDGNYATKDQVIVREQSDSSLIEGSTISPQGLRAYEQRLLGLGLFSGVDLKPVNGRILQKDDVNQGLLEVQEKDLRVELKERPAGAVEFGPGFRTDLGLIGFAELNYRNLGGWNRSVFLRSQVSRKLDNYQFLEQKYSIVYLEPYFFDWPLLMRARLNYRKRDDIKYKKNIPTSGFNSEETTFALSVEREVFENFTWRQDLYEYSISRIFDKVTEPDDRSSYYQIASIGTEFQYDLRDNIFNPTRGASFVQQFTWAIPELGGDDDSHYLYWRQQANFYMPLGKQGAVFAMSGSYSRIWGLDKSQQIPENRRLVLGGRGSIRSLPERFLRFDQAGIVDQQSYNLRFEYRQPIFSDWGVATFFEGGQVDVVRNKGKAPPRRSTGFRKGAGLGLRYGTPVGPVSIDFGYNIDAEPGEDRYRFSLSIGSF